MAKTLTPFNKLPPKQDHLDKVLRALKSYERSEKELIDKTGLTKTQVLCALGDLIKQGVVEKLATKKFQTINKPNSV